MQTALTFVAILTMAMLLLCGTQPAFILLAVLAVVSAVCRIMDSFILRKRTDEKNAKDAVLQKKIANWRKVRRRQLRSNADSDDMFDACGVTQDLRLSLEEDEQFCEKKHEIEELETQINLWNRIGDAFKHLLNSCVILVCLLAFSYFIAFAYCVTGEEGNYYQIGSYATDGSYAMMLNEDIAKEENMTFGDAFDKGLYYSRINIYDFDWFPAYDSTAQEKFEALYEHFGNPSGLYWKTTSFGGMAFNSFDELKAATYEDVGEAKSYWLVWDCDGYTLAAECYDQFDGKETPQETSVTSIYVFPDADESYISHIDASGIVDGYVGSGSAPLCLSGIKSGQ